MTTEKMKVVTGAIRSQLDGIPHGATDTVTPSPTYHMYNDRIVAAASRSGVPTCMWKYPLPPIQSLDFNKEVIIQYGRNDLLADYFEDYFDMTALSTAYATGTYKIQYSSSSLDVECPLSNILFQKDPGNTCVPKFSSKSYNCDNDYQPSGMEVNGGEWVTITFPEAFTITDFLITANESDSSPGQIVIYGLDPDLFTWKKVWDGSANVNTDVFIGMSVGNDRKTEIKFYTYRLVVITLTSMVGCTGDRSLSLNRWSL
jgi:hypothetical protein